MASVLIAVIPFAGFSSSCYWVIRHLYGTFSPSMYLAYLHLKVIHMKIENLLLSPGMQATFHKFCITIFAPKRGKVHTTELLHRIGSVLTLKNPQFSVS